MKRSAMRSQSATARCCHSLKREAIAHKSFGAKHWRLAEERSDGERLINNEGGSMPPLLLKRRLCLGGVTYLPIPCQSVRGISDNYI